MKKYVIGYLVSLYLTVTAYLIVTKHLFNGWVVVLFIVGLALVQLTVQLIFFLHLGQENRPRWNLVAFLCMLNVVLILVFGSLWIMANLNYHHHHARSPADTNTFIIRDEGFKK